MIVEIPCKVPGVLIGYGIRPPWEMVRCVTSGDEIRLFDLHSRLAGAYIEVEVDDWGT